MTKNLFIKLSASVLALSLVAACGTMTDEDSEEEIINEELEEEAPINLDDYNDSDQPTENETNENFGEEIDEDQAEQDIPENYLEKDEETESSGP